LRARAVISRFVDTARRFRSERGNVALVFGLTIPLVIGGAAFGVETSYWYLRDVQLQAAADHAAYVAAVEKRSGSNYATYKGAAETVATSNGWSSGTGTITVNSPPTSGTHMTALAVEVILTRPVQRYFTRLFSPDTTLTDQARAVAQFLATGNACILALHPSAEKSVIFSGNTGVDINGCDVMSNSVASDAIYTQGSSITVAGCFITSGEVDLAGGTTTLDCPEPLENMPSIGDPFAEIPAPTPSGPCLSDNPATLNPGRYCNGMNLSGTVTLNSGVYYVEGGDFKVNANANVTGNGVMIYLSGSARVTMNGNATTVLSAPTTGTYAGILFFGDRNNSGTTNNTYNGTSSSLLTGYLYHPTQPVNYLGNFSGLSGCTRVVASTIQWSGNATIDDTQDCGQYGLNNTPLYNLVRLVE
jgi:Flp pilus assembly protein TadG